MGYDYEVIVVGAGHAGCEAACAAAGTSAEILRSEGLLRVLRLLPLAARALALLRAEQRRKQTAALFAAAACGFLCAELRFSALVAVLPSDRSVRFDRFVVAAVQTCRTGYDFLPAFVVVVFHLESSLWVHSLAVYIISLFSGKKRIFYESSMIYI